MSLKPILRNILAPALLVLLTAAPLHAVPAAEPVKVGFVDVARVLDQAPQAQEARQRIEREFAPRDRELLAQQKEIRGLEDKLVRDGSVMTDAQRTKLESDIRSKKRDLRRSQDAFREDLNLQRSQELSKLQSEVVQVIQALAQEEKYDLILSDGVIFAGTSVDITDNIISRLKAQAKKSD